MFCSFERSLLCVLEEQFLFIALKLYIHSVILSLFVFFTRGKIFDFELDIIEKSLILL